MEKAIEDIVVAVQSLPKQMREAKRWLLWKSIASDKPGKKPRKVPFYANGLPRNGDISDDAAQLVTLKTALKALRSGKYTGLGFALGRDENGMYWQGIDLDDVEAHGLEDLVEILPGYVERSPSGRGYHAIGYGPLFESATSKTAGVEFYAQGRFFTVTAEALKDPIFDECDPVDLTPFIEKHLRPLVGKSVSTELATRPAGNVNLDDWAVQDEANRKVEDLSFEEIRAALMCVPRQEGYDAWLQIGMALYHQFDGAKEGRQLWHEWSKTVYDEDEYDPDEIDDKWRRGKLGVDGKRKVPVTARLILKLAGEDGKAAIRELRGEEEAADIAALREELKAAESEEQIRATAESVSKTRMDDLSREMFATAIVEKFKSLGLKISVAGARRLVAYNGELGSVKIGQMIGSFAFPDLTKDDAPKATLTNFRFMLDTYGVTAKYNVMAKKPEFMIPGMYAVAEEWDNAAFAELESMCELNNMSSNKATSYALRVAAENPYHPVADWITAKPWDGMPRLEKFFNTVKVQEGYPKKLRDILIYRWMISAVAAIFNEDGFESRGVLVFTGAQSIGKTRWFKRLAPRSAKAVLDGAIIDPENRDSVVRAVSHWIVELGELDGLFKKADIARLKAFVTMPFDKLRQPYAKAVSQYQRRTVFCGSVNDAAFLVDDTGNTRWWTVAVEALDYQHKIDMQQVWAEIYEHYEAGERWHLSKEEEAILNEENQNYEVPDPIEEKLRAKFDWANQNEAEWRAMTATEILRAIGYDHPNKGQAGSIGRILKKITGKTAARIGKHGTRKHLVPPLLGMNDDEVWEDEDPAAGL